jgi:AAA15 family ATPase/GTPase
VIAEFTVENFFSFKERQTFSLVSSKDKELLESNTFESEKKNRFLKSAVIYGANASGKSNFFKALVFFLKFSLYSGPNTQIDDPIKTVPFTLSRQKESAPSSFEIIFIIKNGSGETRYRYGFSVNKEQVETEYLFAVYNTREVRLFSRNFQDINFTRHFKEGARGKPSVRDNCTFLSVCAQNNGEISTQIVKYYKKIQVLSGISELTSSTQYKNIQPDYKKKIVGFLKYADIQIIDFNIKSVATFGNTTDSELSTPLKSKIPKKQPERIQYGHTVYDEESPAGKKYLDERVESAGTRKLFSYSGIILRALENGTPLFIDEFDNSLHPLIIEGIVKLFNSPISNPKNAQLVISCHAVNIMTNKLFRRDQIWFCEKNQYGATDLYSLVEYKEPVRKDSSYNKNYLQGKYGAIPYINEILLQMRP